MAFELYNKKNSQIVQSENFLDGAIHNLNCEKIRLSFLCRDLLLDQV